jgi:hypothetical protein
MPPTPPMQLSAQALARDLARDDGRSHGEFAQASINEHASSITVDGFFLVSTLLKSSPSMSYQNAQRKGHCSNNTPTLALSAAFVYVFIAIHSFRLSKRGTKFCLRSLQTKADSPPWTHFTTNRRKGSWTTLKKSSTHSPKRSNTFHLFLFLNE